jgi:hypothetical protein
VENRLHWLAAFSSQFNHDIASRTDLDFCLEISDRLIRGVRGFFIKVVQKFQFLNNHHLKSLLSFVETENSRAKTRTRAR